jgi:hypothetical protein
MDGRGRRVHHPRLVQPHAPEHAFDSDSLFTQQLETDQDELFAEVVRDYWRSFMYPWAATTPAG